MKSFYFLILTFFTSTFCFAQYAPLTWAKALQGKSAPYNSYCDVVEMEADAAGNVYVCGNYQDTLVPDYNNQSYMELGNDGYAFFAKYDASGNFLWSKRITRVQVRDLCLDKYGNIYLTGIYDYVNSVDFDPSASFATITVSGNNAMFFAKYDNNGNYLMAKAIPITGLGDTEPTVIATDSSSNIFIGGKFRSSIDMDPGAGTTYIFNPNTTWNCNGCPIGFYAKYDNAGAFLWAHEDLTVYQINEIAVKQSTGDILVGGSRGINIRYVLPNGTSTDSINTGGNTNHSCTSAVFDTAGNLYVAGYFANSSSDMDWGPGTASATTTTSSDYKHFLVKYDANRVFQWMGVYDFDGTTYTVGYEFEIKLSSDGNLLAAFDLSTGTTYRGFTKISTATNGPMLWQPAIFGNGNSGYTHAANIASVGNSGSFYFHFNEGYSNAAGVYDVDPNGTTSVLALGYHGVIAKYGDCTAAASTPGVISGTSALCSAGSQTYSVPDVLGVSSYTWTLPNGWSGTSNTNSITVTPSANGGNISVVGNNVCGTSSASSLAVSYTSPPNVGTSATATTLCAGEQATLTGTGATTYLWNNNVTDGIAFTPVSTNTYTVTGTTNGCSATATVSVTVNSIPNVGTSATSTEVCTGGQTTLTGTGATTYSWNNNVSDGTPFTPASTNTYTVTGTTNGCSATATVSVTVNSIPNVGTSATSTEVCTGGQTTLTGTGATTYLWNNNVTDGIAFTPVSTNTYTVTGTELGCTATASISITVNLPAIVSINLTRDTVCIGESTTLVAVGSVNYQWNTADFDDTLNVSPVTTVTYSVTSTDVNNCSSSATRELAVYDAVDVSTTVSGFTITANATNAIYQWRNCTTNANIAGANSQSYTVTANGDYEVQVTSVTGCADTSACVNITGVGVNKIEENSISVSPNPFVNQFVISFSSLQENLVMEIYSALGQLVKRERISSFMQTVLLSEQSSGIYQLRIISDENIFEKKLMRQ